MRQEPTKRIETNTPQTGLNAAFTGIQLSGLPQGPAEAKPVKEDALPTWKMGRVVLRRETAHRSGKTVVVIHDFATHLPQTVIEAVAKKVRSACGCGGTVKEREIEIQGDQPAKVRAILEREGFQVAGVK